ncbi:Protein GrpE [Streptococcus pneumoniae]|nr:Protein GrpE [Streptococcus pneumoniae]
MAQDIKNEEVEEVQEEEVVETAEEQLLKSLSWTWQMNVQMSSKTISSRSCRNANIQRRANEERQNLQRYRSQDLAKQSYHLLTTLSVHLQLKV